MEIGRYVDFHATDGDTSDYGARLDFDGTSLVIAAATVTTGTGSFNTDVYVGGELYVPNKIVHTGDTNTYMQFHQADFTLKELRQYSTTMGMTKTSVLSLTLILMPFM